jgi:uncharacterized protein with FMN-binding domain
MKKHKKLIIILSIILVIIIIGVIAVVAALKKMEQNLENLKNAEFNIDLNTVEDGVYDGAFAVTPISVEVKVTVANHKITKIDITKHDNGQGAAAESIIDKVIEKQSLDVDAVTGATYSSVCIKKAIEDALTKD